VVSGGPGTGKTTLLVALLACLAAGTPGLRVALVAPTGKAAARMAEAVQSGMARLPASVPRPPLAEASTIHRLLGVTGRAGVFRHDAARPLPIDALIVDEASMLDLALATRLLEAVPAAARIVLLGDQHQLAAVEAGAVFAELSADPTLSEPARRALAELTATTSARIATAAAVEPSPLRDSVVWLERNYRFAAGSAIGRLATAINARDAAASVTVLRAPGDDSVAWLESPSSSFDAPTLQCALAGYAELFAAVQHRGAVDPAAALAAFARFRVLAALREGPRGVEAINRLLARHGRAAAGGSDVEPVSDDDPATWFPGRPVLVLRNDELLGLFNGDVGLCLPDERGAPTVFFAAPGGGLRGIAPLRLPVHETAYAMTVHKAQGSEFDAALVVLPGRPSRVVTRELLYTAVTRARQRVVVSASETMLSNAVVTSTHRASGLLDRLRELDPPEPPKAARRQAELF
ncbi:MAG: exodeoxyribonuclease V subunit alpha, partial [Pseudomonadota bacterium]|nr:exodeoxyribonuclease V subunit alpha [Pseudomonadota bacterium]